MNGYEFLSPEAIYYGKGVLEETGEKLNSLGNKVLIVTDEVMNEIGYVDKVADILKSQNIKYKVYDEVNSEPTDNFVKKGLELYEENNCDFILALGGGSPIDTAKAIAAMVNNPGDITDYMGLGKFENESPPLVAIPTTSGTGSEVTQFTIIDDTTNNVKMLIGSEHVVPNIAIDDPELTMSVPKKTTAATGIDALTHAIEAYTSIKNQPLTDDYALSAIERISKYLRRAWANGDDEKARNEMMLAAMEAGLAFNNSSVTIVHGMSRPIGALFHVPHGISNAVLLPACMEFAAMGIPERFADVAKAMGVKDDENLSDLELAKKGIEEVKKLSDDVEIPSITGLGIDKDEFMEKADKMAEDAIESGSPANTAREPSKEEIVEIYRKSL